jgi:hypothetical protein
MAAKRGAVRKIARGTIDQALLWETPIGVIWVTTPDVSGWWTARVHKLRVTEDGHGLTRRAAYRSMLAAVSKAALTEIERIDRDPPLAQIPHWQRSFAHWLAGGRPKRSPRETVERELEGLLLEYFHRAATFPPLSITEWARFASRIASLSERRKTSSNEGEQHALESIVTALGRETRRPSQRSQRRRNAPAGKRRGES